MAFEVKPDAWYPEYATPPLSDSSDGYWLLEIVDKVWGLQLDHWQRQLIIRVLETYPEGHPKAGKLRFRQVVISLPRQNGKSELAAVFGLYGLLQPQAQVIGIAETVDKANIVYGRVRKAIQASKALSKRYKPTGTRGISNKQDTEWFYRVKPGGEEKLNSIPMTLCLYDELHLIQEASYDQAIHGTTGTKGTIIGITTAGDDNSLLLKRLYEKGRKGDDERFGFFLWEAPANCPIDAQALIKSNPAIACGRLEVDEELRVVQQIPEHHARRYRLNQFVSTSNGWIGTGVWAGLDTTSMDASRGAVFAVARTPRLEHAAIVAAFRHGDTIHVELVASLVNPTEDKLEALCVKLNQLHRPSAFVMEGSTLRGLKDRLQKRGIKTARYNTLAEMQTVCAVAYAEIAKGTVTHSNDALLNVQVPRGVAVNVGDGWRISVKDSPGDIDGLYAMVQAIHGVATIQERKGSIFV